MMLLVALHQIRKYFCFKEGFYVAYFYANSVQLFAVKYNLKIVG